VNRAAAAGKPGQLVGGALVVVEHDQTLGHTVDGGEHIGRQRKVEDGDRAARHVGQIGQRRHLAVIEPGTVQAGDSVRLAPGPREVNLRELFKARVGL
jgi:hypothetical protein